jgi:hypothetical protein
MAGWLHERRRVVLLTAAALVLAGAIGLAALLKRSPGTSAQTALVICVIKPGHGGCQPGPCDVARHRRAVRAGAAIAVGVATSTGLVAAAVRR